LDICILSIGFSTPCVTIDSAGINTVTLNLGFITYFLESNRILDAGSMMPMQENGRRICKVSV